MEAKLVISALKPNSPFWMLLLISKTRLLLQNLPLHSLFLCHSKTNSSHPFLSFYLFHFSSTNRKKRKSTANFNSFIHGFQTFDSFAPGFVNLVSNSSFLLIFRFYFLLSFSSLLKVYLMKIRSSKTRELRMSSILNFWVWCVWVLYFSDIFLRS